ncbi:putative permease [Singulisphaera acidiphila DSM 18658]|uniref:Putative permease n=1 Tax=Singulisphaera acidiphila (strain ATCC BAA-1392 / DSM 18658 / VKM B-2454 / MOB10) TaxID=886293 RepID=L0D8E5_SINAD|nr:sodium-dependent bicarbonate transport family permease [Singulisphaera acidiphila]AGA25502.1 putative permease [Singulisphaera acidiphila DSM 18658]
MNVRRFRMLAMTSGLVAFVVVTLPALAEEIHGTVKSVDPVNKQLILTDEAGKVEIGVNITKKTVDSSGKKSIVLKDFKPGTKVVVTNTITASKVAIDESANSHGASGTSGQASQRGILGEFWYNFRHNLFKPLLLFFYLGFLVPILKVKFEFPYVIYQGLTIYLLLAIGWHGGEELAAMDPKLFGSVFGFMTVGFMTNFVIGVLAYLTLNAFTNMRKVDKATVAGYYGSDSAGTFVTCLGVLASTHILYDAYMPVMLAVMEIPGCLVALYLVSRLRHQGMDALGNMPDEVGYDPKAVSPIPTHGDSHGHDDHAAIEAETELALEKMEHPDNGNGNGNGKKAGGVFSRKLLHEVFLNSGLYLLFGGIAIGFISGLQGPEVTRADDSFFVTLFQGILCLFLLEMGMTASRKLKDLRRAGWPFVAFGIIAPNVFATLGIFVAHAFSTITHTPFQLGTYVLFAVLCGASSYIAVPAVQRMAIPEASPTLPLAASLGLTFSYNVTIGIPVYIEIAKVVQRMW